MFDGIPDQFHQFIPSRTSSLPLPLCTFATSSFDNPYTSSSSAHQTHQANELFIHPLHHQHHSHNPSPAIGCKSKDGEEKGGGSGIGLLSTDLDIERERSITEPVDLWSHDEVFALLKIRSSMDSNWFPHDFTWEHASRRLEALGFKRSAEKCKEKFEEESRAYFSTMNYKNNNSNNYRLFSELEEICQGDETTTTPQVEATAAGQDKNHITDRQNDEEKNYKKNNNMDHIMEENSGKEINNREVVEVEEEDEMVKRLKRKKRKRRHQKFETLKVICEGFVSKMMAKQEELHNKFIEDMVKRDEEKTTIEEARKKQEMERMNKEIEIREHEQAIASGRQTVIIEFLKKFSSGSQKQSFGDRNIDQLLKEALPTTTHQNPNSYSSQNNNPTLVTSSSETLEPQTPTSTTQDPNISKPPQTSSIVLAASRNPDSPRVNSTNYKNPQGSSYVANDYGKRWPKDEVLALINIRCSFFSNGEDKEGANNKVPLWERISQRMLELGYKRSAKRCKEKWENINKYFRKTKDANRKRSLDSRTCPYFQQLSSLYKQGTLIVPSGEPENGLYSPRNPSEQPENCHREHSQVGVPSDNNTNMHTNV